MFIKIGDNEYELRTTLGVVKALETKSKKTLNELMAEFAKGASVDEMLTTLKAGADKDAAAALEKDILDNCDLVTIQRMCDEFFIRLCFGGTPEEQEEKIEAFPASPRRRQRDAAPFHAAARKLAQLLQTAASLIAHGSFLPT